MKSYFGHNLNRIKNTGREFRRFDFDLPLLPKYINDFLNDLAPVNIDDFAISRQKGNNLYSWILGESSKTVVGWFEQFSSLFIPEGVCMMNGFSVEQRTLLEKIYKDTRCTAIYYFEENDVPSIWVVIKEADVSTQVDFSRYYVETIKLYHDFVCDYMVFGESELLHAEIPPYARIIFTR